MSKKQRGLGVFHPVNSLSNPAPAKTYPGKHTKTSTKSEVSTPRNSAKPFRNRDNPIAVDNGSSDSESKWEQPPNKRRKHDGSGRGRGMSNAVDKMDIDPQHMALGDTLRGDRKRNEGVWVGTKDWTKCQTSQKSNTRVQRRDGRSQGDKREALDTTREVIPGGTGKEQLRASVANRGHSEEDVLFVDVDDDDVKPVARRKQSLDKKAVPARPSYEVPDDDPISDSDGKTHSEAKRSILQHVGKPGTLNVVPSNSHRTGFLSPEPDNTKSLSASFQRSHPDDDKDELANSSPPETDPRISSVSSNGQVEFAQRSKLPKRTRSRSRSPEMKDVELTRTSPERTRSPSSSGGMGDEIPKQIFVNSSEKQLKGKTSPPHQQVPSSSDLIRLRGYQGTGGRQLSRQNMTIKFDRYLKSVQLCSSASAQHSFEINAISKYYRSSTGTYFFADERPKEGYAPSWHFLDFMTPADLRTFVEELGSVTKISNQERPDDFIQRVLVLARSGKRRDSMTHPGPKTPSAEVETALLSKNSARRRGENSHGSVQGPKIINRMKSPPTARQRNITQTQEDYSRIKYETSDGEHSERRRSAARPVFKRFEVSTRSSGRKQNPPKQKAIQKYSERNGLGQPWKRPLIFPRQGVSKATVEFADLTRLDDEEFLNDSLISFCIRYAQSKSPNVAKRVHFFNSFFYETLMKQVKGKKGINYEGVRRWTSKVKLFDNYDYVVVPINENLHWYAAIICNLQSIRQPPDRHDLEKVELDEAPQFADQKAGSENPSDSKSTPDELHAEMGETRRESSRDPSLISGGAQEARKSASEPAPQDPDVERTLAPSATKSESIVSNDENSVQRNISAEAQTKESGSEHRSKPKSTSRLRDPNEPMIITLDSFDMTHAPVIRSLKDYLKAEAQDKLSKEIEEPRGHQGRHIPMQQNFCDCGLYLVGYIAKFLENPLGFVNKLVRHEFDWSQDWSHLDPEAMRHNIRDIIFSEHRKSECEDSQGQKSDVSNREAAEKSSPHGSGPIAVQDDLRTAYQEFTVPRPELRRSSDASAEDRKHKESPQQSRQQSVGVPGPDENSNKRSPEKPAHEPHQTKEDSAELELSSIKPTRGVLRSVKPREANQRHLDRSRESTSAEHAEVTNRDEAQCVEPDAMMLDKQPPSDPQEQATLKSFMEQVEEMAAAAVEQSSEVPKTPKDNVPPPQGSSPSPNETPKTIVQEVERMSIDNDNEAEADDIGPFITAVCSESDAESAPDDRYASKYFENLNRSNLEYTGSQTGDNAPQDPEERRKWSIFQGQQAGAAARERSRSNKNDGAAEGQSSSNARAEVAAMLMEAGRASVQAGRAADSPSRPSTRGKQV